MSRAILHSVASGVFLSLSLAAPAVAEGWHGLAWSGAPIHVEGALVLHDDGSAVHAFSASARTWTAIAASGSPVIGTGDWVAVLREPTGLRCYSARRNASAAITNTPPFLWARVEDDIAVLAFGVATAPTIMLVAYSAVTNTFDTEVVPNVNLPADLASSRFVAVVRGTDGFHGFSARHAQWQALAAPTTGPAPLADGNVGLVETTMQGLKFAAAFSGVRGTWSTSPPVHTSSTALLDHNMVYVRAHLQGTQYRACGYSAYTGMWITSTVARTGPQATYVSDNVILLTSVVPGEPGVEALGARPGLAWATYLPTVVLHVPISADYAVATEPAASRAVVFSGLCKGTFVTQTYQGPAFSTGKMPRALLAIDSTKTAYGYSPATHAFAIKPLTAAYTIAFADAVVGVTTFVPGASTNAAFSARAGTWVDATPISSATFVTAGDGSFVAHQQVTGPAPGSIHLFDERCSAWTQFQPGAPSAMHAGRNVLLIKRQDGAEQVSGYSVQRGAWSAPAHAPGPALVAPIVDENVGCFVDAAGTLWAFGAHGDLHVWYQWPNCTEYQASGIVGAGPGTPFGLSFQGSAAESALLLLAPAAKCPGVTLPGWDGLLCLDLTTMLIFGPIGPIGSTGVMPLLGTSATTSAPACLQVWFQGAFFDATGKRFGARCDPLRVF